MKKIILTIVVIPLCYLQIIGQAGSLDPTFGIGGMAATSFPGNTNSENGVKILILPDGKIISAGYLNNSSFLYKTSSTGVPDNSFGVNGISQIVPFLAISDALVQNDEKIVITGTPDGYSGYGDVKLARFNADGTLDKTFGVNGVATRASSGYESDKPVMAIQSDGKILIVKSAIDINNNHGINKSDFFLLRFNSDGSLDNSFGNSGVVMTDFNMTNEFNERVVLQPDGKIIVTGTTFYCSGNCYYDGVIARYNSNGTLDNSFSEDGKLIIDFGNVIENVDAVFLQTDGKIMLTGNSGSVYSGGINFILARINSNGILDNTFDGDGILLSPLINLNFNIKSVLMQPNGKFIAGGNMIVDGAFDFAICRFNADGNLDNTFNGNGIFTIDMSGFDSWYDNEQLYSIALQGDNKVIAIGFANDILTNTDFALTRINTDGSPDNNFSGDGKLYLSYGQSETNFNKIILQPDGKTIAIGRTRSGTGYSDFIFAITRYNNNGTPDNSFDEDGKKSISFYDQQPCIATEVFVQPDNKIVIAGTTQTSNYQTEIGIAKLNPDGSFDETFDGDGKLMLSLSSLFPGDAAYYSISKIKILPNGKMLFAGSVQIYSPTYEQNIFVARLNSNGSLDETFNGTGKILIDLNSNPDIYFDYDNITDLAIQSDGKILAVGNTTGPSGYYDNEMAVLRFNDDGSLDNSFNEDGILIIHFSDNWDYASAVTIQNDGKIVVGGSIATEFAVYFALVRLNTNGELDNSFDEDGKQTTDMGPYWSDLIWSTSIQADGKIIAAGYADITGSGRGGGGIARYNTNGSIDNSFGNNGKILSSYVRENENSSSGYFSPVVFNNKLYICGTIFEGIGKGLIERYNLISVQLSCPSNAMATLQFDQCSVQVNNIDPVLTPAGSAVTVNYNLAGATTGSGTGSVSGMRFNTGVTTVTYSLADDPSQTCSFTVTINSYTLLGMQGIKLQQNNTVINGSVGVVSPTGSASIKKNVSINGPGSFLKAQNISLQSPYTIPTIFYAPATVALPTMQYNTTSTGGLPNATIPNSTTTTITGDRKNVTIGTNCNITLTGAVFGSITIGSGSSALFTQSSIDVTAITMNAGTVSANTQLKFSGDAIVRCAGSILVNTRSIMNPDNYKVVMYLGKTSGSPVTFTVVAGGNATVNASMYIPSGKISVGGDATNTTYMNGKFIAENIETLDKNVIWNWYDCTPALPAQLITSKTNNVNKEQTGKPIIGLNVKAWPNPSEHQFTLNVESNSNELVSITVYDMFGRKVYSTSGTANRQYQFGNRFVSGAYVAEVKQGVNRSIVKLIKQ